MTYSYTTIQINRRDVLIQDILSQNIKPLTEFESNTFSFIASWLSDKHEFAIQTSGSTGLPKEIIFTRTQLQASAHRTIKVLNLHPNGSALVCLNTQYIAGKMMLVRAFECNLKIIAVEPSADPISQLTESVDFVAVVPLQLQSIVQNRANSHHLEKLHAMIVGGAAIPPSLLSTIKLLPCPVYATYGMTETISHIALQRLNGTNPERHFTTLPGISIQQDERGCLIIQLPELAEKIITNDLVDLLTENTFRILGRWDSVINSGGVKVSPEKVEQAVAHVLAELQISTPFCVTSLPDDRLGEKVILIIESDNLSDSINNEILQRLPSLLVAYEIPKKIYWVNKLVYTPTGKVHRNKSRQLIA